MALLNTNTVEVRGSPVPVFTATQETVITGMIVSNRLSSPAFLTIKKGSSTLLINAEVLQGKPLEIGVKIGLNASESLSAYATSSPVGLLWNNGTIEDWNSDATGDWGSASSSPTSLLITYSYAEV